MNSPNIVRDRLLEAMLEGGFVKADGTPNKRALAKRLCELAGGDWHDGNVLARWERNVYNWTRRDEDGDGPGGMSDESAELASRALDKDRDYFKQPAAVAELVARSRESDAALAELGEAVESLTRQLQAQQAVLERLERLLTDPRLGE